MSGDGHGRSGGWALCPLHFHGAPRLAPSHSDRTCCSVLRMAIPAQTWWLLGSSPSSRQHHLGPGCLPGAPGAPSCRICCSPEFWVFLSSLPGHRQVSRAQRVYVSHLCTVGGLSPAGRVVCRALRLSDAGGPRGSCRTAPVLALASPVHCRSGVHSKGKFSVAFLLWGRTNSCPLFVPSWPPDHGAMYNSG